MKIPTRLKHKPVVILENYERVDGSYQNKSDAKGLSLGLAQWNEQDVLDISAKVWRHTGEKWSRQSEELPLHRVLDLAILTCHAMKYFSAQPSDIDSASCNTITQINLQGNSIPVELCESNESLPKHLGIFKKCLKKEEQVILARLKLLFSVLKTLRF